MDGQSATSFSAGRPIHFLPLLLSSCPILHFYKVGRGTSKTFRLGNQCVWTPCEWFLFFLSARGGFLAIASFLKTSLLQTTSIVLLQVVSCKFCDFRTYQPMQKLRVQTYRRALLMYKPVCTAKKTDLSFTYEWTDDFLVFTTSLQRFLFYVNKKADIFFTDFGFFNNPPQLSRKRLMPVNRTFFGSCFFRKTFPKRKNPAIPFHGLSNSVRVCIKNWNNRI